jgi:DNA helicase-2/ATP-dependent DNA helicase PcrA
MSTTPEFEAAYKNLNAEQKKAVDTIDGPVMVIAGPGTGKTQVLSLRVGNILKRTDIRPGNILCLTFTDAAQVNMRERLSDIIGPSAYKVGIYTFHGFAREVISSYPEYFYDGADFAPADELTQLEILESVFEQLPRKDPLSSIHEEQFTYIKDAKRSIGLLKQAGITPQEFSRLIDSNAAVIPEISRLLGGVLSERLSKGAFTAISKVVEELTKGSKALDAVTNTPPLAQMVGLSLARALTRAIEEDKTAPLSEWKQSWLKLNDADLRVFKDELYIEKMRSLARIYSAYRDAMKKAGYYDFDDMLLDVVSTLEAHPALLADLEERYQYILVDEFQDTNDAQLRLVRNLGSAAVNEGKPNIMIVGDDDQAIYRFQGAEISNILDFPKYFKEHALIVLTKNYRSTQHILDVAREVIEKSEERLERVIPTLEKKLVAARPELGEGHIVHMLLPTRAHEYAYIAREVKKAIANGTPAKEIAIISRRHRELEDIARVLVRSGIPINYERKQNVFEEEHISVLVVLARFVVTLLTAGKSEADHFLPKILTAPFWGIHRADIWQVATDAARRDDRLWIGAMQESTNPSIRSIAQWLLEVAARAQHEPLERVLDELIGSDGVLLPGGGVSEEEHDESVKPYVGAAKKTSWKSTFREFYFGPIARRNNEPRYLLFLSSLRVFVGALREFRKGRQLLLSDLVEFADMHERSGITLADTTPFASAENAVNLMTAHKAKGLEFDTVFVISCQEDVWVGRGFPNKLPFPINLPIEREEGGDDRLRIFYVALTRARQQLFLSAYRKDDAGKDTLTVNFIKPDKHDGSIATHLKENETSASPEEIVQSLSGVPDHASFFPVLAGEQAILKEQLVDYCMSVTHLNNFLNVSIGGPTAFLEQNLLRFPQAMSPSSAFGSAMHKAIELFYRKLHMTKKIPSLNELVAFFAESIEKERMMQSERRHFRTHGEEALAVWWEKRGKSATAEDRSEVDFRSQGVVLADVQLTGKIDKMTLGDEFAHVVDFKTGKAKPDWEGKDLREKITLHNYKRQLIFYKILVEHSHEFSDKRVHEGTLEFLEPVGGAIATLTYTITDADVARLTALISAVHKKIMTLDFPDCEGYSKDLAGVIQFEDDLIAGTI